MPYRNKTPEQIRKKIEESTIGEPRAEIVRSRAISPFTEGSQAMISRLVKERVDEILSASGMVELESDFQSAEAAKIRRRAQDMFERVKWSLYFEKWGCHTCGKKTVAHMSTGHCTTCHLRITGRLAKIKRDYERAHPQAEIERNIQRLTLRARTAEALLGEESEK